MGSELTLVLPVPPNIANLRAHWAVKARKQKRYRLECRAWEHKRPPEPIVPALVSARFYLWNRMDDDNLTARLKWPLDWLVEREIIANDDPSCMTLGEVSQEIDGRNPRLVITIRRWPKETYDEREAAA